MFLLELNGQINDAPTNAPVWQADLFPESVKCDAKPLTKVLLKDEDEEDEVFGISKVNTFENTVKLFGSFGKDGLNMINTHSSDPGPSSINKVKKVASEDTLTFKESDASSSKMIFNKDISSLKGNRTKSQSNDDAIEQFQLKIGDSSNNRLKKPDENYRRCDRDVFQFVFDIDSRDIDPLRKYLTLSISNSIFFSFSFKSWNWLLKIVSNEKSVADILWHYLTALSYYTNSHNSYIGSYNFASNLKLLPHPGKFCILAGSLVNYTVKDMHSFLQTLSVIVQANDVSPLLKALCFKAWTFEYTSHEKDLLLTLCGILASVGNIMSQEEDKESKYQESLVTELTNDNDEHLPENKVKKLVNVIKNLKIIASSNQKMISALMDDNLETFWESNEDNKLKPRCIMVSKEKEEDNVDDQGLGVVIAVYINNDFEDKGYNITSICFKNMDITENDICERNIMDIKLRKNYKGWVKCLLTRPMHNVQVHAKSQNAVVRIRQIVVLGYDEQFNKIYYNKNLQESDGIKQNSPLQNNHFLSITQSDAFQLFQAITAQAFEEKFTTEDLDKNSSKLRNQIIDLLFGQMQLQPLRSYVCYQIMKAFEKEVINLTKKRNKRQFNHNFERTRQPDQYNYVLGLINIISKLCELEMTVDTVSIKKNALILMSELLSIVDYETGKKVLLIIDNVVKICKVHQVGKKFIRNLMKATSRAFNLCLKNKVSRQSIWLSWECGELIKKNNSDNILFNDNRRSSDIEIEIHNWLLGMANETEGNLSDWAILIRTEAANCIMTTVGIFNEGNEKNGGYSMENLSDSCATASLMQYMNLINENHFWLTLVSLSLLSSASWLELSDFYQATLQTTKNVNSFSPFCDNHDDGETKANIHCIECNLMLCRGCFSTLHLSKQKRNHVTKMIGNSHLLPRIEIHEGSIRLRIEKILLLVNGQNMTGMMEICVSEENLPRDKSMSFKNSSTSNPNKGNAIFGSLTPRCRFCDGALTSTKEIQTKICSFADCQQFIGTACLKVHPNCNHLCYGIANEKECLDCLKCPSDKSSKFNQDCDDLCTICFTDKLGAAPCIKLTCSHIFHFHCVQTVLLKKWHGPRISFRFMKCPLCSLEIEHEALEGLLEESKKLIKDVQTKALMRFRYEFSENELLKTSSEQQLIEIATEKYMYVLCFKCKRAYFGGDGACHAAVYGEGNSQIPFNPEELVCGGCSDVLGGAVCTVHGSDFMEFKCRYCCSVALFFCFGTTHFCVSCHTDFQRLVGVPLSQLPQCPVGPRSVAIEGEDSKCPLDVEHPPTGTEFSLGCGVCKNLRTF
uniref:B box-type domain-containing protein n=1 Tax=Rhabditophanes sp. KR3021 TaxID=114890 RepID=A0AC35TMX7_9BILA